VNYYHPSILPLSDIQTLKTSPTKQQQQQQAEDDGGEDEKNTKTTRKQAWAGSFSLTELSEEDVQTNQHKTKQNFRALNRAIRLLGHIPLMCMLYMCVCVSSPPPPSFILFLSFCSFFSHCSLSLFLSFVLFCFSERG
jgi:hypothetical protein